MTSLLAQISFCAIAVECALIFYAVLYIVEELFIRLYHKIKDKSNFIKKELSTENDTVKITGKQFIARISILLGIFVLINIFFFIVYLQIKQSSPLLQSQRNHFLIQAELLMITTISQVLKLIKVMGIRHT